MTLPKVRFGFHPLKAGRRLAKVYKQVKRIWAVSIPSRRVGDSDEEMDMHTFAQVSIPSRRVGDPKLPKLLKLLKLVSIPSRRVGDQDEMKGKAGKRGQNGRRVAVDLR